MNDFTLKELEEIDYRLENAPQWLEDRIRDAIKNYCEHKFTRELISDFDFVNACTKCDALIRTE